MKKSRAHFARIKTIAYEGPDSANPLAFRHYNPDEIIDGQSMSAHLRFSIAYWHAFRGVGSDPFGPGTIAQAHKPDEHILVEEYLAAIEHLVEFIPQWCNAARSEASLQQTFLSGGKTR